MRVPFLCPLYLKNVVLKAHENKQMSENATNITKYYITWDLNIMSKE
jgi:hypothetical protein